MSPRAAPAADAARPDLPLGAILVLAAVVRIIGINGGFPDINRYFFESDEGFVAHVIMGFGTGDLNPHWFEQPTFFLYFVFGLYALFYAVGLALGRFAAPEEFAYYYFVTPAPFYLIGRTVSLVAGVLTVWLLYRVGTRLFGRTTGLLAAFFLAIAGLHVDASHIMKTDATSVFFVMAALLASVSVADNSDSRASWLAGILSGLAAATRYPSGAVFLCAVSAHVIAAARTGPLRAARVLDRRLAATCLGALGAFLVAAPFTILDWPAFSTQLLLISQHVSEGGDPLQTGYRPNFWITHWVQLAQPNVLGPTLVVFTLFGCAVSVWRHRWQDALLWPLLLCVYWVYSDNWTFTRTIVPSLYLLPIVPSLLLLAARAVVELADRSNRIVVLGAAVLAVLPHLATTAAQSIQLSPPATKVRTRQWIEQHVPAGSRILIDAAQVPQLSFTPESLERVRFARSGGVATALAQSRRTALDADIAGADRLRTKSLTEVGVPYDLYVLLDMPKEPLPADVDFFRLGFARTVSMYNIEYVVVSSHVYGTFLEDPFDDIAAEHRRYRRFAQSLAVEPPAWALRRKFYEDVEAGSELLMDVRPDPLRSAGPRIKVYRVNPNLAPPPRPRASADDRCDRGGTPRGCSPHRSQRASLQAAAA